MQNITGGEFKEKELVYYEALINAWVQTRMERDKTIISLSAAGIGLLVTLITTFRTLNLWLTGAASICFLITIGIILYIYKRNADYLARAIKGEKGNDRLLEICDVVAMMTFLTAFICMALLGIIK